MPEIFVEKRSYEDSDMFVLATERRCLATRSFVSFLDDGIVGGPLKDVSRMLCGVLEICSPETREYIQRFMSTFQKDYTMSSVQDQISHAAKDKRSLDAMRLLMFRASMTDAGRQVLAELELICGVYSMSELVRLAFKTVGWDSDGL